jgi:hypothetical protein
MRGCSGERLAFKRERAPVGRPYNTQIYTVR